MVNHSLSFTLIVLFFLREHKEKGEGKKASLETNAVHMSITRHVTGLSVLPTQLPTINEQ